MPLFKGKEITPQEAMAKGLCPETGKSLKGVNIENHIKLLWPGVKSKEAQERIDLLRAFAQEHPEAEAQEEAE